MTTELDLPGVPLDAEDRPEVVYIDLRHGDTLDLIFRREHGRPMTISDDRGIRAEFIGGDLVRLTTRPMCARPYDHSRGSTASLIALGVAIGLLAFAVLLLIWSVLNG